MQSRPLLLSLFILFLTFSLYATIPIESVNTTTVGLYEKFEVVYDLSDFSYDNPYDPDQIDVTAIFTSPSGKEWNVFGFYDDYKGVSKWKVRFAPNEIGEWTYIIRAEDADGHDYSEIQTFTAVESEHHGWIKISEENPRYMEYDDGSSYFGVGMYTPWKNDVAKFDKLESFGGNTFAIWNIMYGGLVNGHGIIEEELGRYNQTKCGKIDTLLIIAEERDMNIMYCFWPHDLFSATVWAHQWHQNPYRHICDVEDVYSDETCWEYQKKQYRYLIARFSYSRALGIWEIMNEINGTDGWAAGRHDEARNWVKKVHEYFKANDAYQHLTTASRSGGFGEYWPEMYELIDLPNLHVYETQGWAEKYPGNTLRSSMYNYAFAASRFWNNFDQPAILGEAGADWVRVDVRSPGYEALYHNAIWATLTNGIASTPYWWTFTNPIRDEERQHMKHLSTFVADIDFVKQSKAHFENTNDVFDVYGMKGDSSAFGWIRETSGVDVSDIQFDLEDVLNPGIHVYAVTYYNPWTGESLGTRIRPHINNLFRDRTPIVSPAVPDVAFKIAPAEGGITPTQIELSSEVYQVLNVDTSQVAIDCYLFDAQDRFCDNAEMDINVTLNGPGSIEGFAQVSTQNGVANIVYQASEQAGVAEIIASAPGLEPDTLRIRAKDKVILDDFESYRSDSELRRNWTVQSGQAELFLLSDPEKSSKVMQLDYAIGSEYKYTAVLETEIDQTFEDGHYLTFWIQPDGSNREVELRLYNENRRYWSYEFSLPTTQAGIMTIPIEDFARRGSSETFNLAHLTAMRLTVRIGEAEFGSGTLYFDDFKFPASAPTKVEQGGYTAPIEFELAQNYPNPFNPKTAIHYRVPERSHVTLSIYNIQGQEVERLVDKTLAAGEHSILWDASGFSSGLYFYRLHDGERLAIKKCVLAK